MNIISKINNTRKTLKQILASEWDVSSVPDLSDDEVNKMFSVPAAGLHSLGSTTGCNFTLKHSMLPSHQLHIIYMNFPELGKNSSKITKSACNKIHNLYKNSEVQETDNIFIIINENISESLEKNFQDLNTNLQNELENMDLSENLLQEMIESEYPLQKKHFRNVRVFNVDTFTNNLFEHRLVPKHVVFRSQEKIQEILDNHNCKLHQLPIILKNDIVSKMLQACSGDVCEITRKSVKTGEYKFYRVCK